MNDTANRVSVNGQAKRPAKKPETAGKQAAKRQRARLQVERWAGLYVKAAVVLSAGLNGYTATVESHASNPVALAAAAAISGMVPGLVWGLGQLAGWLVRTGWRRLAAAAGAVGVGMLLLSVWHCSQAIAGLAGFSSLMAVLLAVGIDCGLVVSELAAILVSEDE